MLKLVGKPVPQRPDFHSVTTARFREQLSLVYQPAAVYDVSYPLQLNGEPFGTIRIGVSTVFLRNELTPRLMHALYFSIASIFASLLLAAMISNLALGPLKQISRNLDNVSLGTSEELSGNESEHDEFGLVTSEDREPGTPDPRHQGNILRIERQRGPAHVQAAGWLDAVHP